MNKNRSKDSQIDDDSKRNRKKEVDLRVCCIIR